MKRVLYCVFIFALILIVNGCNDSEKKDNIPQLVHPDGTYEVVPLESDNLVLKLIQNSVKNIDSVENASAIVEENLTKVCGMIEKACTEGEKPNIILLHEFPLTGYLFGDRETKLKMALEIPGPESDRLAALAKKYDTYIIFGSYAKDKDWEGHILSLTTVIGRDGSLVKKIWKPRNIKRFYANSEITTTTVEGVQEKFREMYGIEDEFPVIRTEYGNIAMSTAQLDPFVFAAFAAQGAEIFLRTSTWFFESDVINMSMCNKVYSAMSNIPHNSIYGGNSMVVSPGGQVIDRLDHTSDDILSVTIPIAEFREGRRIPSYSIALTRDILDQYVEEIPADHLNLPAEELPKDGKEMKTLFDKISRWLNVNK